jgi:endoglucanase
VTPVRLFACLALSCAGCLLPPSSSGGKTANLPGSVAPAHNLVANSSFDKGRALPWMSSFTVPAHGKSSVVDGELCLDVADAGQNRWDAQLRHREMEIEKGHTYAIKFRARADRPTTIRPKVGMQGPPYAEYWFDTVKLSDTPREIQGSFTMEGENDPTAELAIHLGGDLAGSHGPFRVCIDDVVLYDPQFKRKDEADAPLPRVELSQLGFLPSLPKRATVRSDSRTPLAWELRAADGTVVASGRTRPGGVDRASGDPLHQVDFSSFNRPGHGYTLKVGDDVSHPFDIDAQLYKHLRSDALAFFYHNRSAIPIAMPWAGDPAWARPAGHLGDKSVPCLPGSGCSYTLDVSGGWYDAGDHGKYVVNGGIAVWTLLDEYERAVRAGTAASLGDGTLRIPEHANGVPDLLDEARWELEFMLRMQVPQGQPLAGMVHHKVHDKEWTALGTAPHEDKQPRYLHPPSTAATLNLAATAAQAARIFSTLDPAFARRCLDAAERAFHAARANPVKLASNVVMGGGPYDDDDISDELYWAAAELYLTTRGGEYRALVTRSPHYKEIPTTLPDGQHSSLSWGSTQALGNISLLLVPNDLPAADLAAARHNLVHAADTWAAAVESQGYGVALPPGTHGDYPWGSNSFVLNNLLVMALAHDLTHEVRYLDAVAEGMDYLLGRNPLDQSFVTGYGARPTRNPHHRFWAHQTNAKYPSPPPGAIAGGPNSGMQDPYVQAAGLTGAPPLKCYLDNIESFSTNEVAINWNAPLAWVAAFLDEKGR